MVFVKIQTSYQTTILFESFIQTIEKWIVHRLRKQNIISEELLQEQQTRSTRKF